MCVFMKIDLEFIFDWPYFDWIVRAGGWVEFMLGEKRPI